jgi:hypothetical protein
VIDWKDYKEDCCVVIPVYKKNPVFFEQASLIQCVRILGQQHDIYLVSPFGLDLTEYKNLCPWFKFKEKRMNPEFFTSIDSYNQLCRRWQFYDSFRDYQYMLIYQLDCWVFSDNLEYFISLNYDYIGAPWFEINTTKNTAKIEKCGNGGFSLRRVDKFIDVCKAHNDEIDISKEPEDVFFSNKCREELKISPVDIGREFSFEVGPSALYKINGNKLPMGCHKPFLFEFKTFWKDYIKF